MFADDEPLFAYVDINLMLFLKILIKTPIKFIYIYTLAVQKHLFLLDCLS